MSKSFKKDILLLQRELGGGKWLNPPADMNALLIHFNSPRRTGARFLHSTMACKWKEGVVTLPPL